MQSGTTQDSLAHGSKDHGYRGRVRSGCLTCRSRKVKCDEMRPNCDNCTRLKRHCVYKPRRHTRPSSGKAVWNEAVHEFEVNGSLEIESTPLPDDQNCVFEEISRLGSSTNLSWGAVQGSFSFPGSSIMQITERVESALQRQNEIFNNADDHESAAVSHLTLISRDIKLTTTMDILATREISSQPWLPFFIEAVDSPSITPYDSLNWQRMKHEVVELGTSSPAIATAITALSALYKSHMYNLPSSKALSLYNSSKIAYEELLDDDTQGFSEALAAAFLLCLFEFVEYESVSILKEPTQNFLQKLENWSKHELPHSELSLRIIAWLRLLHGITLRGGGTGMISDKVCSLFPSWETGIPNLKSPSGHLSDTSTQMYEVLSTPIFDFYFRLQMMSEKIARLTHYHRSRATGVDQEEVNQGIAHLKSQIYNLWESRSATQRQTPKALRSHLAPQIANPIIKLAGICSAAYYTEIIEMDRVLGDPVSHSTEASHARHNIREIIDGDWNVYEDGKLNTGYLRPLFMYAIECMDREENQWAVERLEQIRNPICRSTFFASFGKALSDAQLRKERRVTSKYFCIWNFGVPPPFM